MGFEPTPPKRLELESSALDHSATEAVIYKGFPQKKKKEFVLFFKVCFEKIISWPSCFCLDHQLNCRSTHGLVGYDDRLTRGRSPVQFRVGVYFSFVCKKNTKENFFQPLTHNQTPWPSG